MSNKNSELGQYLRSLRQERNLTLHQLSKEVDIDLPMLSKIETGSRLPTSEQIVRISKFFKVSESEVRAKHIAQAVLKNYGANDITLNAMVIIKNLITKQNKRVK